MTSLTPRSMLRFLLSWPVESQQTARRNALVASTALAQLNHERTEVERFLEEHARRRYLPPVDHRIAARG